MENTTHQNRHQGLQHLSSISKLETKKIKKTCTCGAEFDALDLGPFTRELCDKCVLEARRKLDEDEAARVLAEEQANQQRRVAEAKITPLWKNVMFENSDPGINKKGFAIAKKYAEDFTRNSPSLFLCSKAFGAGKTHLAACIANYVLNVKKMNVRFQKARDLLLDIRHTYSDRGSGDEADILNMVLSFDLLVLDDVGIDHPSDWQTSLYWTVFDRRMEYCLPVVVTSNYPIDGDGREVTLGDRIGDGAISRLRQMCAGNIIIFRGKDLR